MLEEITTPLLMTEWGRRMGFLLTLLFTLLCAGAVIQIIGTWKTDHQLIDEANQPTSLSMIDTTSDFINQLPKQHLFGNSDIASIPMTSLPLRLIGVIQSSSSETTHAIISETNHEGKIYHLGDRLIPNVSLSHIAMDSIILNNNGHLEKLAFQRNFLTFKEKKPEDKT